MPVHKNIRRIALDIRFQYLDRVLPRDPAPENQALAIPPLRGDLPRGQTDKVTLFAACDAAYYRKHAKAFIGGICANAPGHPIHLHVINPDGQILSELSALAAVCTETPLSFSWEEVDLEWTRGEETGVYYCTCRFLRLSEFMQNTGSPTLCLDIDALVVSAQTADFLAELIDYDMAFFSRFKKFGNSTKLLAGTLFINQSDAGKYFFSKIGTDVYRYLSAARLLEKLDQQIIYSCYLSTRKQYPNARFRDLAYPVIDLDFTEQGLIWYPKGNSKKEELYSALETR